MNIRFDPVTTQYVIDFGTGDAVTTSLEDLKSQQFPSEQTLRTERYLYSPNRGHSHPVGNGCRYCNCYNGLREPTKPCPYSEF